MASSNYGKFVNDLKDLNIKKKGKKPKVSPQQFYPAQQEAQATELMQEELDDYSAKMEKAAQTGDVKTVYDVLGAVPESFRTKAAGIALGVHNFNVRAFANFSEMVVGERFFVSADNKNLIINTWTENFVNLCKSTNEEMRKKVAGVVSDGVLGGRNLRETILEVQQTCTSFSRSKAELIATTEIGKLNSAIARDQSESAGIPYYEWSAAMDGRTRESHAAMDGRICKWGDDDGYFEWEDGQDGKRELKRHTRPGNAYRGAPGTDFRCRCVALPYVPEYEDDYVREDGKVQGVTQERPDVTTENKQSASKSVSVDHVTKKFFDTISSFGFVSNDDSESFKNEMKEKVNRLPDNIRKKWLEKANEIKIEKKGRPPASCASDGTAIHLCSKSTDTIIHEVGHATSIACGRKDFEISVKSKLSPIKAMKATLSGTLKDRCLQVNLGSLAYKEFVQGLNKDLKNVYSYREKRTKVEEMLSSAGISPNETILSTISDWLTLSGYDDFGWGHPKAYQKRFKDICKFFELPQDQCVRAALSIELGAEIPELLSAEGGNKFLKTFLPKTFKEYEDNVI